MNIAGVRRNADNRATRSKLLLCAYLVVSAGVAALLVATTDFSRRDDVESDGDVIGITPNAPWWHHGESVLKVSVAALLVCSMLIAVLLYLRRDSPAPPRPWV